MPTFCEPMELLSDCHRRIEKFLGVLRLIVEQSHHGRLEEDHREAFEQALRYFREAAPKHTADEEESLFPRLRSSKNPRVQAALEKLRTLEADHRAAHDAHAIVECLGGRWLVCRELSRDEITTLRVTLRDLDAIYKRHIHMEDHEVFPMASEVLPATELKAVGNEMASRRGLDPAATPLPPPRVRPQL